MKLALILLAVVSGAVLPIQAALNGKMGRAVGDPIYAALISFIVGSIGLLGYVVMSNTALSSITEARHMPLSVWLAGIVGAFYVACVIILAPKLGVALTFALIVTGQMGVSLLMDHFGLIGIPVREINLFKVFGIMLIIAGVIMIRSN